MAEKNERIESVDLFRLIAIIAVIMIHTSPFYDMPVHRDMYTYLYVFINQLSRFAVPFFFVISGFFWGCKVREGGDLFQVTLKALKRLLFIFLAWSFIYLIPYNPVTLYNKGIGFFLNTLYLNTIRLSTDPLLYVFQGTRVHLWFLMGLICALLISSLFVSKGFVKLLMFFSLGLYVFGLMAKAYSLTPIGIDFNFNTRNGPFFSTIFFVTGFMLTRYNLDYRYLLRGFLVFIFGCFVHFLEAFLLWNYYDIPLSHDFLIGTYFMGIGVALMALSNHSLLRSVWLSLVGRYVLGIYVVHMIFLDVLNRIDQRIFHPAWEIGYVFIVLTLATITTYILSKNKYTRKIVM